MIKVNMRQATILLIMLLLLLSTRIEAAEEILIFPIPQELHLSDVNFELDESVPILIPENPSQNDLSLARLLVKELSDKYGKAINIKRYKNLQNRQKAIIIGSVDNPLVREYINHHKIDLDSENPGPEGYVMEVTQENIFIGGSDSQGAFYGLQSLRQLIGKGNGDKVQGLKVRDWPRLPFRGVRLYVPGPDNIAFFKRFLADFMALYKFNKVILELNCMRLDKHPEVNAGWIEFSEYMKYTRSNSTEGIRGEEKNSSHYDAGDGLIIEKNDVKNIVRIAEENFIEVIPEIPSLTHGYYLLTRHPELAEYPGDRWPDTYCPSNPASYELMFDVYDEYIDVIKPKMIHIGHDEWWGAPTGVCPRCKGKDYSRLFANDVNKIHDYLANKGIKVAMWGDYLLESVRNKGPQNRVSSTGVKYQTPGALPPEMVRESIPKDILVFNWFWVDQKKEKELYDLGLTQIYGNFKPNISNWDNRLPKVDVIGGAPSSWAATNEFNFGKDLMLDFLGCANLLWSPHTIAHNDLPEIVWQLIPSIRRNLSTKLVPSRDGDPIIPIDISSYFNFTDESTFYQPELNQIRAGEIKKDQLIFKLPEKQVGTKTSIVAVAAIGVGEDPILPKSVKGIQINEDVSSLIFLHAAAQQAANQKAYFNIPDFFDTSDLLGWYEVVYEDGYKINVPIQYGVNILEWNPGGDKSLDLREGKTGSAQLSYAYEADAITISSSQENNPITFFAYEWVNPRFGKKIKEVNLFGSKNYQSLQQDYGKPVTEPMESNAVFLGGISKVIKREPYKPTR
ncbi:MAG: glycoside hydrolase family 20 zincin-like fold domain-containing protein [Bacteroidota bacterium]